MIDRDLAALYGVETKVMNQAVKRNIERFPAEFRFQLTKEEVAEYESLRSQFVTLRLEDKFNKNCENDKNSQLIENEEILRSQIVTSKNDENDNLKSQIVISSWGGNRSSFPYAFASVFVIRSAMSCHWDGGRKKVVRKRLSEKVVRKRGINSSRSFESNRILHRSGWGRHFVFRAKPSKNISKLSRSRNVFAGSGPIRAVGGK